MPSLTNEHQSVLIDRSLHDMVLLRMVMLSERSISTSWVAIINSVYRFG